MSPPPSRRAIWKSSADEDTAYRCVMLHYVVLRFVVLCRAMATATYKQQSETTLLMEALSSAAQLPLGTACMHRAYH